RLITFLLSSRPGVRDEWQRPTPNRNKTVNYAKFWDKPYSASKKLHENNEPALRAPTKRSHGTHRYSSGLQNLSRRFPRHKFQNRIQLNTLLNKFCPRADRADLFF